MVKCELCDEEIREYEKKLGAPDVGYVHEKCLNEYHDVPYPAE